MKQKISVPVVCVGLICITALEFYALSQSINGFVLTAVIGIIAAAIGINIPKDKFIKKTK
ncbi:MAG: hypothetical protein CMI54_04255 [Parcubacteria group bacterium]|nr:hypothetical protein [Parcubacteria group bacterium]|tara:strand:+ start:5387 stop:5566 length:180 start_codon:yes stop_codon:yes gene_type:complete